MTSLINKLLGKDTEADHSHDHKHDTKCESGTCSTSVTGGEKHGSKQESSSGSGHASGTVSEGRTVQRDGVNIKSTISTDGSSTVSIANQQRLTDLVSKLGSTHSQIDSYAKNQTEKINEQIQHEIDEVVGRIHREQDDLLRQANSHTAEIDKEYHTKLQAMVEQIDADKAKRIAAIEADLNNKQAGILQAARNEIDTLNKKAAHLKIGVLEAAEAKVATDSRNITANANLGQASTVHQASGTTTIKTEVSAAATTNVSGGTAGGSSTHGTSAHGATVGGSTHGTSGSATQHTSESKTVETSHHQSNDSRK